MTRKQTTPGLAANVAAAAAYGAGQGIRTGVAVLDLHTGEYVGAGAHTGLFGSASVMKVLIAVQLLATDQLTGDDEVLAAAMIERSDDDAVKTLWPLAGGTDVINLVETRYLIKIGTPNTRVGYWGNTHISAKGMVHLYRAVADDPKVWSWLGNAMHHAQRIAADGTDQFFGIPSATSDFGVKQGWGTLSADSPDNAIINTTGYVEGDRYAVAILGEGPNNASKTFNTVLADIITAEAKLVMPDGHLR